jgi:hypothetical protein
MMVKWISGSDTSTSEVEIVDSESDNSVDIQAWQWIEVKTSWSWLDHVLIDIYLMSHLLEELTMILTTIWCLQKLGKDCR